MSHNGAASQHWLGDSSAGRMYYKTMRQLQGPSGKERTPCRPNREDLDAVYRRFMTESDPDHREDAGKDLIRAVFGKDAIAQALQLRAKRSIQ